MNAYRGGRVPQEQAQQGVHQLQPLGERCFAADCPMPGTIFLDVTQGGTSGRLGCCAWHFGVKPFDIPKVTGVLNAWLCVSQEVQAARRVLTGPLASSPGEIDKAWREAWERLQPQVLAFAHELEPHWREGYGNWAHRLEAYLGGQVVSVLSINQRRTA